MENNGLKIVGRKIEDLDNWERINNYQRNTKNNLHWDRMSEDLRKYQNLLRSLDGYQRLKKVWGNIQCSLNHYETEPKKQITPRILTVITSLLTTTNTWIIAITMRKINNNNQLIELIAPKVITVRINNLTTTIVIIKINITMNSNNDNTNNIIIIMITNKTLITIMMVIWVTLISVRIRNYYILILNRNQYSHQSSHISEVQRRNHHYHTITIINNNTNKNNHNNNTIHIFIYNNNNKINNINNLIHNNILRIHFQFNSTQNQKVSNNTNQKY